ncbi:MAG: L-threonylcarbamoyladenylate synthase [Anaerolineae bacterium]|nr:L-threonylcarbamoyladenylate synthase [Anaerolineae bacterium]
MSVPCLSIQQPEAIAQALADLRDGKMVIVPTDTVYGVAVIPDALDAMIRTLYEGRHTAPWPALPLLLDSAMNAGHLARLTPVAERLMRTFWPGVVTLILPAAPDFPFPLSAPRIALRVPNSAPLRGLLQAMGGYLIVGRAARSGYPSCITAAEAVEQLGDIVSLVLDGGPAPYGVISTVVDCIVTPPAVVQRGAIPEERILAAIASAAPEPRR